MKEPVLELSHIHFAYPYGDECLQDINVKIYQGEKIAVIGNNGVGKSTFFLLLNGILKPKSGDLILHGKKIDYSKKSLLTLRKEVGLVFQEPDNQIIAPTVFKEVSFGPMNLKLPLIEVEERTTQALDAMNLGDFAERAPQYLSGGEKKRLTIADTIAMNSKIIVFDEPTAGLDYVNAVDFEKTLGEMHTPESTFIISTHDINFAYRWANRVLLFAGGTIVKDGSPNEVFSDTSLLEKVQMEQPVIFEITEFLKTQGYVKEKYFLPTTAQELIAYLEDKKEN